MYVFFFVLIDISSYEKKNEYCILLVTNVSKATVSVLYCHQNYHSLCHLQTKKRWSTRSSKGILSATGGCPLLLSMNVLTLVESNG